MLVLRLDNLKRTDDWREFWGQEGGWDQAAYVNEDEDWREEWKDGSKY